MDCRELALLRIEKMVTVYFNESFKINRSGYEPGKNGAYYGSGSPNRIYRFDIDQGDPKLTRKTIEFRESCLADALTALAKYMRNQYFSEWELDGYHKVDTEYTDLFAGEANYSWVKRETFLFKERKGWNFQKYAQKAKRLLGMQRGRKSDYGDMIEWRWGTTILFVK